MLEKMDRYVDLYESEIMGKPFPHVLILSEQRYPIDGEYPFKVFQAESFTQFLNLIKKTEISPVEKSKSIKIKIG